MFCLWQAELTALRVLDLFGRAPKQPLGRRHRRPNHRRRRARNQLTVGPHREVMQGGERNVVILGDVGSGLFEIDAGGQ
jgi:hypothetical protein